MQLYGLKNCDTCRKAIKVLQNAQLVDVRAEGMPDNVLAKALEKFGSALVNTRSTTWRGLSEAERTRPPQDLLSDHPTLMKRPLIVDGEAYYLGWTAETQTALGVDS
jgi:arsenate reductase